ncbi:uncharacterized protein LOC133122356 [Conger conger]|uniref:uncharacterized protein LOC133122356 n=1 Tax=Conger conger TaxID=82655 RepID=UPI002A5A6306|nr:uncharacterized protein LOC133122356 [Conger conger]
MEEEIIFQVSSYPCLYDLTANSYRNLEAKNAAWRKVASAVTLPEAECRKKWRTLRDGYMREKRRQKKVKQRSGAASTNRRSWKYSHAMAFLDPYFKPRATSTIQWLTSRESEIETTRDASPQRSDGSYASQTEESEQDIEFKQEDAPEMEIANPSGRFQAALSSDDEFTKSHQKHTRQHEARTLNLSEFENRLIAALEQESQRPAGRPAPAAPSILQLAPAPQDEDEDSLFARGLVPCLRRLPRQKNAEVKIKIQQLLYDAEFS